MFDLRRPIKIFVANGEVRYGSRVDNGFFPVFSVDLLDEAKLLIEIVPWACTDSLTSYAHRLEEMSRKTLTEKYETARKMGLPNSGDLSNDLKRAVAKGVCSPGNAGPSAIAQAIMGANEDE
jgi:hypothetical protein